MEEVYKSGMPFTIRKFGGSSLVVVQVFGPNGVVELEIEK